MRLRLEVCRHRLPTIKIIWNAHPGQTISEVLHSLDPVVPLEAEHWGLEDYVLETEDGFETLHYQQVDEVLTDDQQVRIRPISTNDVRIRRLTGRSQINNAGRHILDGVPFGQPMLKAPSRPKITIPSLKLVAHDSDCDRNLLALENGREDDDEDDDDEWSQDEAATTDDDEAEVDVRAGPTRPRRSSRLTSHIPSKSVGNGHAGAEHREGQMVLYKGGNDDDSAGSSERRTGTKRKRKTLDQSDEGSVKRVRWQDQSINAEESISDSDTSDSSLVSSSDSTSDDSESSEESDESSVDVAEHDEHVPAITARRGGAVRGADATTVPPGHGKAATKSRNRRRKEKNKLLALKGVGLLPANAGKQELTQLMEELPGAGKGFGNVAKTQINGRSNEATDKSSSRIPKQSKEVIDIPSDRDDEVVEEEEEEDSNDESYGSSISDDVESPSEASTSSSDASSESEVIDQAEAQSESVPASNDAISHPESPITTLRSDRLEEETRRMQERRLALLDQLSQGGVDVTDPAAASGVISSSRLDTPTNSNMQRAEEEEGPEVITQSGNTRKLDLGASQRMLLGSLGHRAPRNAAERAKLTEKLDLGKEERLVKQRGAESNGTGQAKSDEVNAATDPDYWKAHIELSAVECVDPGVELSTPPFPFYQRWDPSQQRKKRKRNSEAQDRSYVEDPGYKEYYFAEGHINGDGLDYDENDELVGEDDGEEWNGLDDAEAGAVVDDLPPLPTDPSTLPKLAARDMQKGDIIIFRRLEVSAATSWAPALSPLRTAKVLNEKQGPETTLRLQLAARDLPDTRYDHEGNRVYEKFEVQEDDQVEDDCILNLSYGELVDPRLLATADEDILMQPPKNEVAA